MATRADSVKPTSIKDKQSLIHPADKDEEELEKTLGKWIVFRYLAELDDTWDMLKRAFDAGKLKAEALKSSTMYYNPSASGPGCCVHGAIRVFTQKKKRDFIGNQLIKLVKHDIRYKSVEATEAGALATQNFHTLFWNAGKPTARYHPGIKHSYKHPSNDDLWQQNVVRAPLFHSQDVYGKWIVSSFDSAVTKHWHLLKGKVESGELGVTQMVCPARAKKEDPPVIEVYTTREEEDDVGEQIDEILGADQVYELC